MSTTKPKYDTKSSKFQRPETHASNHVQLHAQHASLSWSAMLKNIVTTLESTDALVDATMTDILSSESVQASKSAPGDEIPHQLRAID